MITQVASRSLLSGRVGYERAGWSLYLWGTNLLDDQYELGLFDGRLFGLGGAYGRHGGPARRRSGCRLRLVAARASYRVEHAMSNVSEGLRVYQDV